MNRDRPGNARELHDEAARLKDRRVQPICRNHRVLRECSAVERLRCVFAQCRAYRECLRG